MQAPILTGGCFCPDCGAQLTFLDSESPDEIDVTTCSLDTPESVPPADHVRTARMLSWIRLADDLPKHKGKHPPKRSRTAMVNK
jgi:hypothetical protein